MLFKVESGVNGIKSAWRDSQASPGSRHDERLLHETSTLVQDKSCPSHSKDIQAALMLSMMTHSLLSSGWDPVGTPCIPLHTLCRCLTYPGVPNSIKEPMLRKCLYTAFLLSPKLVVQFSGWSLFLSQFFIVCPDVTKALVWRGSSIPCGLEVGATARVQPGSQREAWHKQRLGLKIGLQMYNSWQSISLGNLWVLCSDRIFVFE